MSDEKGYGVYDADTSVRILEDVEVELIQASGGDAGIVHAARVSTMAETLIPFDGDATDAEKGIINYLMREKHGTPFEHNSLTFRVHAPIFVFREWHRHRIQSYNEQSGRYSPFQPVFYVPGEARSVVNKGTSARPDFQHGAEDETELHHMVRTEAANVYLVAFAAYERMRAAGVANEVARIVLPTAVFSTMYATTNLRGWLHFLGLRTEDETAAHVSHPQREIEMAAEKIEAILTERFPIAMAAFNKFERVAP